MNITQKEFVKQVANETGVTQKLVKEVLTGMADVVLADLSQTTEEEGVKLSILPSIIVESKYVAPHTARNPQDGGTIEVPGKVRVKARATKTFIDNVNA